MANHQFVTKGAEGELVVAAVAAVENLQSLARGESTVLAKVDFQVWEAEEVNLERMKKEECLELSRCLLRTAQRTLIAFDFIFFVTVSE